MDVLRWIILFVCGMVGVLIFGMEVCEMDLVRWLMFFLFLSMMVVYVFVLFELYMLRSFCNSEGF